MLDPPAISTLARQLYDARKTRTQLRHFSKQHPQMTIDDGYAIQREWAVNLGLRDATERMAHLFCELFLRLSLVGLVSGHSCEMPVTQADLAEATGLSPVHVNRTLQELRRLGLIVLKDKTLTIPDLEALADTAQFNPNYLHLGQEGRHLDANDR